MSVRLRMILPYTLPGVLALIGCWWFFSRKKDRRSKSHRCITAPAEDLQVNDRQTELIPTQEATTCSRAQPVQLNRVEDTPQDISTYSFSSAELANSLLVEKPDSSFSDGTQTESVCLSQESPDIMFLDSHCNGIENSDFQSNLIHNGVPDLEVCSTSDSIHVLQSSPDEMCRIVVHKDTKGEPEYESNKLMSLEEPSCNATCMSGGEPCDIIHTLKEDLVESGVCTEHVPTDLNVQTCLTIKLKAESLEKQAEHLCVSSERSEILGSTNTIAGKGYSEGHKPISAEYSPGEAFPKSPLPLALFEDSLMKKSVQTCVEEVEAVVQMSVSLPSSQLMTSEAELLVSPESRTDANKEHKASWHLEDKVMESEPLDQVDEMAPVVDDKHLEYGEIVPMVAADVLPNSDAESACTGTLNDDKCADMLAFSQYLGKTEQFETPDSVVEHLEKGNTKPFFGNYEAKVVEQLAINIISKVIVAAKQEILSGTMSDMSDSGCQVLDSEIEDSRIQEANTSETKQFASEQNVLASSEEMERFSANDSTCESTQTEQKHVEDFNSDGLRSDACLESQTKGGEYMQNHTVHRMHGEPNLSPVNKSTDSFDEAHEVIDDSNVSSCTSEDGIVMEDPLQSTVLSSVCAGSYDSLSTSGIETSREISVSGDRLKKVNAVESKSTPYSNGDVKRGSPDLKHEGHWTVETEVDHSGGSDVNSMDSVDSGCALGKTEQLQNAKQRLDTKKAELVIWEIEVPKHLVGRLIGKQGRFVSFLKESSGAKIYISTLPYTQDFQICHIEGSQQQVDRALALIGKKFKELNLTNMYAPPPSLALHSLPMTSWLMLPDGVTVEVIVVNVVNAGHMFVQQHTHPTFHALRSLDQQMCICYTQPGIPTLPTPVEVGVICAAPAGDNAWWRAQVVAYFEECEEVEIRYVDYGGYERVKIEILRQIRSDFVTLPFQGAEVLLDNVIPLAEEDHFSSEADDAANEMTRGTPLLAQVTNYDGATGLPLIQLWSMMADEVVSINRTLVERGFAQWIDSY
ncbi:A-kinase anchor protein 1, mitochondrial [Rhinophrynus dorsalis]